MMTFHPLLPDGNNLRIMSQLQSLIFNVTAHATLNLSVELLGQLPGGEG